MADLWPEATELLDILVKKAQIYGVHGMDLYFTHMNSKPNETLSRQTYVRSVRSNRYPQPHRATQVAEFKAAMKDPNSLPVPGTRTDMSLLLGFLLDECIEYRKQVGPDNCRKQSIIALTDGRWELSKVSKVIRYFVSEWKWFNHAAIGSRSMGIQFVQFGDDPVEVLRLELLNNRLKLDGVP